MNPDDLLLRAIEAIPERDVPLPLGPKELLETNHIYSLITGHYIIHLYEGFYVQSRNLHESLWSEFTHEEAEPCIYFLLRSGRASNRIDGSTSAIWAHYATTEIGYTGISYYERDYRVIKNWESGLSEEVQQSRFPKDRDDPRFYNNHDGFVLLDSVHGHPWLEKLLRDGVCMANREVLVIPREEMKYKI